VEPFLSVTGTAAALPLANVDTDVIMPKQFLKGIDRVGLDAGALYDLRFDGSGRIRPEFVLNRPEWRGTRFLAVGPNFGCGSSREHAVWGLMQFGIRAVLGTSFAGIFADNAANNGLLLVTLAEAEIAALAGRAGDLEKSLFTVDLEAEVVTTLEMHVHFKADPLRRDALMRGLDAIGATLEHAEAIRAFQEKRLADYHWLA
jgi:3-isopropylmalate/(R)-2-methylmalate dehydratase small subunit